MPELYSPFAAAMAVKTNLEKTRGALVSGAVATRYFSWELFRLLQSDVVLELWA